MPEKMSLDAEMGPRRKPVREYSTREEAEFEERMYNTEDRWQTTCAPSPHSFDAVASAAAGVGPTDKPSDAFDPTSSAAPGAADNDGDDDDGNDDDAGDADANVDDAAAEAADSAAVTADSPKSGSSARASNCSDRESGRH